MGDRSQPEGEVLAFSHDKSASGKLSPRDAAVLFCALSGGCRFLAVGGDDGLFCLLDRALDQGRCSFLAVAVRSGQPVLVCGDDGGGMTVTRLEMLQRRRAD
jgi:hypothetical protein